MPRRPLAPAIPECDPQSSLMSEPAVMKFLGTDGKGIIALIKQKRLKRDALTGAFARAQVLRVHDEIIRSIMDGADETTLGREQQEVGVLAGFRDKPRMV